jgi:NADH-quinone oxidoreductase subunit H
MHLGWTVLIPANLLWIIAVAFARVGATQGGFSSTVLLVAAGVILALIVVLFLLPTKKEEVRSEVSRVPTVPSGVFDPFAGGYPVPPMPGQVLPEYEDVLVGPGGVVVDGPDEKEAAR